MAIYFGILDVLLLPVLAFAFLFFSKRWDYGLMNLHFTQYGRVPRTTDTFPGKSTGVAGGPGVGAGAGFAEPAGAGASSNGGGVGTTAGYSQAASGYNDTPASHNQSEATGNYPAGTPV